MRHQKSGLKLGRTAEHRLAMFRNMVTSLFLHGEVRTTDAKAKELRRWADKMVTLAKRGDLHARRQALAVIRDKNVVHKLFEDANERFGRSEGGYTRVVKLGFRKGDCAPISLVQLVGPEEAVGKKKPKKKAKKAKAPKAGETKKAPAEKEAEKSEAAEAEAPEAEEPAAPAEEAPAQEAAPEEAPVEEAVPEEAPAEEPPAEEPGEEKKPE
ncbi:MAG: 50S ribosomal protein L17 [Deltaproteobacteria bacterium]|nr:50S ribosomal protein L17 [Deltaproteobacteria bacterium]